jgi:hypothetical protein
MMIRSDDVFDLGNNERVQKLLVQSVVDEIESLV